MGNEENKKASAQIGTLGGCLIEGDSEQKARERKVKRRALVISIGLQSAALVALVVTPLLAKPEKISLVWTPTQIYRPASPSPRPVGDPGRAKAHPGPCYTCPSRPNFKPIHIDVDPLGPMSPEEPVVGAIPIPGAIPGADRIGGQRGPTPPDDPDKNRAKRVVKGGDVQAAMLVRRVNPDYPALAKTLHHAGSVHIRAIIATDGSIESVQLIDGDPLLVQSALNAVGQWRYRPTLLNGSPVEVETVVTVIYTLNQ
jgi:periplasmic protein TonB